MDPKSSPQEDFIIIESNVTPIQALELATRVANVRQKIDYVLERLGQKRWRVKLTNGTKEDLQKAIALARGVKIVEKE
jgi:hypothetical protein